MVLLTSRSMLDELAVVVQIPIWSLIRGIYDQTCNETCRPAMGILCSSCRIEASTFAFSVSIVVRSLFFKRISSENCSSMTLRNFSMSFESASCQLVEDGEIPISGKLPSDIPSSLPFGSSGEICPSSCSELLCPRFRFLGAVVSTSSMSPSAATPPAWPSPSIALWSPLWDGLWPAAGGFCFFLPRMEGIMKLSSEGSL